MAASQLLTDIEKVDEMIVDVITDLRRKHKRANCESIHKEIVRNTLKAFDEFKNKQENSVGQNKRYN